MPVALLRITKFSEAKFYEPLNTAHWRHRVVEKQNIHIKIHRKQ